MEETSRVTVRVLRVTHPMSSSTTQQRRGSPGPVMSASMQPEITSNRAS